MRLQVVFIGVIVNLLSDNSIKVFIINISLAHVLILRVRGKKTRLLSRKVRTNHHVARTRSEHQADVFSVRWDLLKVWLRARVPTGLSSRLIETCMHSTCLGVAL